MTTGTTEDAENAQDNRNPTSPSLPLPPFDEGLGTGRLLSIGFNISCAWAIMITFYGIAIMIMGRNAFGVDMPSTFPTLAKVCTLVFAVITTICSEILGYIHTVSLRWALASEGKLFYNSNLRLFTTSRISRTNGLWANCFWLFSLILCYGGAVNAFWDIDLTTSSCTTSATQTICHPDSDSILFMEPQSILVMGIGLTSLCVLSGIGRRAGQRSGRIKSWNPHPLNTALVCAHYGLLERTSHDPSSLYDVNVGKPVRLKLRSRSAHQLIPTLRHIIRYLFSMSLISFTLAVVVLIIVLLQKQSSLANFTWVFFPLRGDISPLTSQLTISYESYPFYEIKVWLPVVWSCFWQVFPTLTFHIAELVVNLYRDGKCWRSISNPKGAKFEENALLTAFSNKGSITLLVLKPLGQWIFSLGIFIIGFNPIPLLVLSILVTTLALSTFIVARYRPKGPLPATYGHLQSIINLVDDWGHGAQDRLWWGDKGCTIDPATGVRIRLMGTSGNKKDVSEIHIGEEYITV